MTRRPSLRHTLIVIAATAGLLVVSTPAVFAHSEFDLDEVAPGSIVALHLSVENESNTAGTTQVELRFPQPLVIVELPTVDGWTVAPVEGTVGGEAIGVLWNRPTATPEENPSLPLTIGPLPSTEGRLQFKVLQTYSDGTEDAWIGDWPVGAPEPDMPGPVIDLVDGAPGTIPDQTTPTTTVTTAPPVPASTSPATTEATAETEVVASAPTTISPTDPTTDPPTAAATDTTGTPNVSTPATATTNPASTDDDDGSNTGVIIGVIAAVVLVAAGAAIVLAKRRNTTS